MAAASTSETMVNFYRTTWRYNPEDSHCQNRSLSHFDKSQQQMKDLVHVS
jgi:hypothetical protein